MKKTTLLASALALVFFSGCSAKTKVASQQQDIYAKTFPLPEKGLSGIYIYRKTMFVGRRVQHSLFIDKQTIGKSANGVYFYKQIPAGKHMIETSSEFSPNGFELDMKERKNYCINQYIKMGVFVGGANIKLLDFKECEKIIPKLERAEDLSITIDAKKY